MFPPAKWQPGLVACVAEILKGTGVPSAGVHLEITESVMLDNADRTLAALVILCHRLQ
ncbi:MAG: hypothetical protein ACRD04_04725 [Terriglobales bacterium]